MNFIVRKAVPDDAEQILALMQETLGEPDILLNSQPDEFTVTVDDERAFIQRLAEQRNSMFLVAVAGEQVIGTLTCVGGSRRVKRHVTELGIVIHRDWRNRGVGREMIAQVVEWARQSTIVQRITLKVFDDNAAAIYLYKKFGFEIEGRQRNALFKHGRYYDELVMGLLLSQDDKK